MAFYELTVATGGSYTVATAQKCLKRDVQNNFMPEGYCVKCKAKKEIAEAVEETMKTGRKAIKGKCPTCGVVMFKILGGKAATTAKSSGQPS
jgi:Zn finger protein HypA/HybF involved in hydrogenase expression